MEITIPFTDLSFESELRAEEIKYRAILSKDSLFFGFFSDVDDLLFSSDVDVNHLVLNSNLSKNDSSDFKHTAIALNNDLFSVLSDSDPEQFSKESLFAFQHGLKSLKPYKHHIDYHAKYSAEIHYVLPRKIHKALNATMAEYKTIHFQSILLSLPSESLYTYEMRLCLNGKSLSVVLTHGAKLLMANSYRVENESDFYYYVALVVNQFNLLKGDVFYSIAGNLTNVKWDKSRFVRYFCKSNEEVGNSDLNNSVNLPLIYMNQCV